MVKSTPRNKRKSCQTLCLTDPDHVCSTDHIRVPAHCRLKRNKKTKPKRPSKLDGSKDNKVPLPPVPQHLDSSHLWSWKSSTGEQQNL
jgi:hypothetical protein